MPQALNLKLKGLYISNNELDANPEGALSVADEVVIDYDSLLTSRRGFDYLEFDFTNGSDRANQYTSYQDKLIAHHGTDSVGYYDTGTGWMDYTGSFPQPDSSLARTKFLGANQNLYFTSSSGIYKLDAFNSTPIQAGAPKGLDINATTSGVSGFMPDNSQIAYRLLWGYRDLNNNLILGAPSQRAVVINNSGGTRDVDLEFTIPEVVTTDYFYQIYRSPASATSTTEPLDEMQLVYEANPTSAEITAGTVSITDITPDSLKGATLYTSPSQEGILQANEQPVYAQDFTTYKGYTFYANVASRQRLFLTVLAVGAPNGVQIGDVLTIAGVAYTASAAENIALGQFEVITGGTPAQNIADTSESLIRVINRYATNTFIYAYYVSGYNDLPGKILLEERGVNGPTFAAIASANGSAYNPTLPTSGTTVSSTNDRFQNGIYVSKFQQPEAVPLTNIYFAGSAASPIRRIIALRDTLFILKTDGIFRIDGDSIANFNVNEDDRTVSILAPETAVPLANEIWCLSDQGVVSISTSGVSIRSRPIESDLIKLFGAPLQNLKQRSFAIGYETDRKYILFTVQSEVSGSADQAYVFNIFTNTWTRWTRSQTAGFVNPTDNKIYLGAATNSFTSIERKTYTYRDFIDELVATVTISSIDLLQKQVTVNSVTGIEVGDLLYQSASVNVPITAIDTVNNILTVAVNVGLTLSTASIFKGINCVVEWQPNTAQNPGLVKQFPEISALFRSTKFFEAKFQFRTELSQFLETVMVTGTPAGGWGLFGWGSVPWGGSTQPKALRTYVPRNKQLSAQIIFRLGIRNAYSDWKLLGVSLPFNEISTEITK
jgi:hypothetical protein